MEAQKYQMQLLAKMEVQVDMLCFLTQPKEGQQQIKKQTNKQTKPELPENRTVWKSENQGVKEEIFIQTSRRGRDRKLGVCLTPQFFLTVYLHLNVGLPSLPAAALLESAPPTSLDECFFFNSLVVRLPYCSMSVRSGCFLFLNLLLFFFWLCKEA